MTDIRFDMRKDEQVLVIRNGNPLQGRKGSVVEAGPYTVEVDFGDEVYAAFEPDELMVLCDLCGGTAGVHRAWFGLLCDGCSR